MGIITAPEPLTAAHNIAHFDCGEFILDEWLRERALQNQASGASRCFVICEEDQRVIGYYALASGSIERAQAPGTVSRAMPDPIPVVILARLAVSQAAQGRQLGSALLRDALLRTLNVGAQVGVRALLVQAISLRAKQFYQHYGFIESRFDPMILMLPLRHIATNLPA